MARKLAIKRLTASDLTLFESQFRKIGAGNQKAINLNADVFVSKLYPSLPETEIGRSGRIPIDLYLYGPGHQPEWNLQRKIIKQGSYKNWRLDGEFISNPIDNSTRFDSLAPQDYAIFEFNGEIVPTSARIVFVAAEEPDDVDLHQALLAKSLGSMAAISPADIAAFVAETNLAAEHPLHELLLESDLEDAARGGLEGTRRLMRRRSGGTLTREELRRARQNADDIGRQGEELILGYCVAQQESEVIEGFMWDASLNAICPYDFTIQQAGTKKVDVKSTRGNFDRILHISVAELLEMRDGGTRYDLYRVYELDSNGGKLRIAEDLAEFAGGVLRTLEALPAGITCDAVSVKPSTLTFGPEIEISIRDFPSHLEDESAELGN